LDCRTLCALKFGFLALFRTIERGEKEKERRWLIVEKGKERIRGVVIVYSVKNGEGKKVLRRRKLLYSVYNRARWRHEARRHTK
jgi:hypothetical protein